MSVGKIIVLAFVIISAIVFAIRMIYGYRKGMGKAIVSFVCVLLAALFTFLFASPLSNLVAGTDISGFGLEINGKKVSTAEEAAVYAVEGIGGETDSLGKELMKNEVIATGVKKAPALIASIVVGPLFFLMVYLVLRLIMVFACDPLLRLITRKPEQRPNLTSKLVGMGVGLVSSVVFCGVLFMTSLGTVSIAAEADADIPVLKDVVDDFGGSAFAKVYSALGFDSLGKAYMNAASSYTSEGENAKTVHLADELSNAAKIYSKLKNSGAISSDGSSSAASAIIADPELVYSVTDVFKESDLLKEALPVTAKYMISGADKGPAESSLAAKLDNVTNEQIDELLEVYSIMDETGITDAIAEKDTQKLREIISDGDTAERISKAVEDSELARAVVSDTVSSALREYVIEGIAASSWDEFDLDKLVDSISKADVDKLYDYPDQGAIVALVGNEKLTDYVKNYDRDAAGLDRSELKSVIVSVMEQYNIDGEALLEEAQKIRDSQ